jgi:hypothetical protein
MWSKPPFAYAPNLPKTLDIGIDVPYPVLRHHKPRSKPKQRLIPFDPAAHYVVLPGLIIGNVLVLFQTCQPDGKTTDRCPARRSTLAFAMRKHVRVI